MANRLSKEKANLIATHYCTNDYNKTEALLSSGYSKTYAMNVGLKLFVNDRVMEAIERIEAAKKVQTARTVQSLDDMLVTAYDLAKETNQSAAMVSACTAIARLYGMDKQTINTDQDEQRELSEAERLAAERISRITLMQNRDDDDASGVLAS